MARVLMVVLWPSFLVAIVAEGVFFSMLDPGDISVRGWESDLAPLAVYTVGFFFFWLVCAAASMLTCYLANPPEQAPPR